MHWLANSKPLKTNLSGWICFQIGLLFLASSAFISGIFFVIAVVLGSRKRFNLCLKDKWNYPLLIASFLMLAGSVRAFSGWLAWVGLANWLPFFWCFWAFQPYVLTAVARRRCALLLLVGTIPVVFSGIGQLWFGLEGPWQFLNGLIIWFIEPGGQPTGRLSGLFNYANIAGAWLALVWPIALATLVQPSMNWTKRSAAFLVLLFIAISLVLTNSRNAWASMFLSMPFVLGTATWFWVLPLMALSLFPVLLSVLPFVPTEIQFIARKIVPEGLWSRLTDLQFATDRPIEATRIFQWKDAIALFYQKPWFGYGAAAFSVLYPLRQGIWHGHAHNLPLELTVAHGLPVAILLVCMILLLLIISFRCCFFKQHTFGINLFDRAWWASTFTLIFIHGADIPMFDSRINLAGWIFLSGLRCLIASKESERVLDV
ncbi:Lipid A core O-antigen ligase related enzyme [Prochlorococcus sp. SS52]|nr:Lipid A core O-antigen ligase related enzyme [Prochlorococcus marinus str. LG]KGG23838.1 Lipid A core O-antigen ligase related enzyme [Prochlorococcus marinus str. SS35]KGG31902.1 Lipid A core O-antigen ligase related enzyme [Prochlorococcus marinus str. SS51]KGG35933.1 Lipid A core O-antigen ligase related enzyme [Prochlorococcus sp. SS52]